MPDLYITSVTPESSAGVTVTTTSGTVMYANVSGGTATFTVNVINISDKVYVYERTIDGAETGFEGIYTGTDIKYEVSNVNPLDEISPDGGTLSFVVKITVPSGVKADNYVLKFNFIEKTGTEILPGNDEFDITFKYNNGQPDTVIKVHETEYIPRPSMPTRPGYTFIGWYSDAGCTDPWNFDIDKVTGDMTLYAGWEYSAPSSHLVTLKPNNGEEDITIMVEDGNLIPIPSTPTNGELSFIGWYKDETCIEPWNFDTDKVYGATTLYAGWEVYIPPVPPEHTVTFKPNNGDPDTTITVLTGDFIPRPATPVKVGYNFIGWYVDEQLTTAWNFEVNRVDSNITLFGGWDFDHTIESVEYTITLKPNNGTSDIILTVNAGEHVPRPTTPTRSGYIFAGWYTDSGFTSAWNFDTDKPTSNLTLYGKWEKDGGQGNEMHGDFMGLVEALLSTNNNCLNHNDLIFDAIMESLTSKKRPPEDAPILHCSVNSVSGGTMSAIAEFANANLTDNLHFIFEVDPNPEYQDSRLILYMYYSDVIYPAKTGDEIVVYKQIISLDADGKWFADGSYVGYATVGNYFGGGNSGKDVKTISPYTWKAGSLPTK